jgi:hypothetical protein
MIEIGPELAETLKVIAVFGTVAIVLWRFFR